MSSPGPVESVGQLGMAVICADPSPEAAERWSRRSEALADWLLSEWQREHQENN